MNGGSGIGWRLPELAQVDLRTRVLDPLVVVVAVVVVAVVVDLVVASVARVALPVRRRREVALGAGRAAQDRAPAAAPAAAVAVARAAVVVVVSRAGSSAARRSSQGRDAGRGLVPVREKRMSEKRRSSARLACAIMLGACG